MTKEKEMKKLQESLADQSQLKTMCEKYWSELSADEKIERMRKIVKAQVEAVRHLENNIRKIEEHSHSLRGDMLLPYHQRYGMGVIGTRSTENPDEVYF